MKAVSPKNIAACTFLALFLLSCGSSYTQKTEGAAKNFYSGDYNASVEHYRRLLASPGTSRLLYMMELGIALHAAQKYEESNRVLLEAERYSKTIGTSVSKQGASLLLNEGALEYQGEDFELILIHMYTGLNFLLLGNIDSARVEFNRVALKLKDIRRENGAAFKHNVMAKYLTAVCYEAIGDRDRDRSAHEFAYLEYRQIYALQPATPHIREDLVRMAHKLGDGEGIAKYAKFNISPPARKDTKGDLLVIHQLGRGAYKKSRGKLMQDDGMRVMIVVSLNSMTLAEGVTVAAILVALANVEHPIPDYAVASNKLARIDVLLNGKNAGRTATLENISQTARLSAAAKYEALKNKVAAGIATKAVAAIASGIAAKKIAENTSLKNASGLIGYVTSVTVGSALASQIKPDLRCWHTLPDSLQILRLRLEPGEYKLDLKMKNENGDTVTTESRSAVVKKSSISVINYRSIGQ